ncbi:MAG: tail fiber domain-containing protein [Chloracidobacterium sp.]|nr:tail fiber domain-containing protein [Chloracidobacterium sp.]
MKLTTLSLIIILAAALTSFSQTTEFTYQGSLKDGAIAANGNYDFEFKLFDLVSGGTQQGSTLQRLNVAVANGIFAVSLDFGAGTLPGADRYLDIAVRTAGGGVFTALTPRNKVNSSPYSVKSLNSTTADAATNATQLGGVAASQYVVTTDPRMTDARPPTAGSTNYIQNGTSVQASSNFNISGTGTANILNAATQYNIGGSRVMSVAGTNNLFAGAGAGTANTTGGNNSFFGRNSGSANTSGSRNSFVGSLSGNSNTTGSDNVFIGSQAGQLNTGGLNNVFIGSTAGVLNATGNFNTFVGAFSGQANTTGLGNVLLGIDAGYSNTTGNYNTFVGTGAGRSNTTAGDNAFFGQSSGYANTTGSFNAFFGGNSGSANTTGNANSFFGKNVGVANTTGFSNAFFGTNAGDNNSSGGGNSFFGRIAGTGNTTGSDNAFFGFGAGAANTTGGNNTIVGHGGNVGSGGLSFATAIGSNAVVTTSNTVVLGRIEDTVVAPNLLQVDALGAAGATALCRNASNQIATCSSSMRYKANIDRFASGLSLINRLKPITFDWKDGGMHDLGLGAEDVAAIEPLLVTYNSKGEVEGVKYDRIGVVLVNAVKEQQKIIEDQQTQIDALIKLVCLTNKDAEVCKEK